MANNDDSWRLEQHIGTILQFMVIALLGWSLKTSVDMQREIGILQAKLEGLQTSVSQGTNDRYRGTDAARDFASIRQEMSFLEKRIVNLEGKHK